MERIIDTVDGDILVRTAFDYDSGCSYLEFYEKTGYEEELFPWSFVAESDRVIESSLDETPDSVLEDLYYEALANV